MATRRYRARRCADDPAAPCGTCPYRRSTPVGVWDQFEYDKLRETDAVDPQEAMRRASAGEDVPLRELLGVVYQCHLDDGTICRGWLADQKRRGLPSLALRLELSRRPDLVRVLEKVDENDPDLYGSLAEMCAANAGQPFPESNPRARKLLRLKQRGNRKKKPRSRRR